MIFIIIEGREKRHQYVCNHKNLWIYTRTNRIIEQIFSGHKTREIQGKHKIRIVEKITSQYLYVYCYMNGRPTDNCTFNALDEKKPAFYNYV